MEDYEPKNDSGGERAQGWGEAEEVVLLSVHEGITRSLSSCDKMNEGDLLTPTGMDE